MNDPLEDAVKDLQRAAHDGAEDFAAFGEIRSVREGDLVLLNYTVQAQAANIWTPHEIVSRGLIIHAETGDVVARPFEKFFNWEQGGRTTEAELAAVTEKVDGSLGISYRTSDDKHAVATRGSFGGEQAVWATNRLNHLYDPVAIPPGVTALFEIVYPGNRIIVDYGDRESLVLLALRDNRTGAYLERSVVESVADELGTEVVPRAAVDDVDDLLAVRTTLGAFEEGFVAEFADGSRFKFKSEEYLALAKRLQGLTFGNVVAAVRDRRFDEFIESIPDEYLDQAKCWNALITNELALETDEIERVFASRPTESDRGQFAAWAKAIEPRRCGLLFALLDGRDIRGSVLKNIEKRHAGIESRGAGDET